MGVTAAFAVDFDDEPDLGSDGGALVATFADSDSGTGWVSSGTVQIDYIRQGTQKKVCFLVQRLL